MTREGLLLFYSLVLLQVMCLTEGCQCPAATVLPLFPSETSPDTCCLNYTGSSFTQVPWSTFLLSARLQVLDLSSCNISHIDHSDAGNVSSSLRELYMGRNRLTSLPSDFLSTAYSLEVLDLGMNRLKHLPELFLRNSGKLQVLILSSNRLSSVPGSVLKPFLGQLDLQENPWACTCSLWVGLHDNSSSFQDLVGNLTCASPQSLAGRSIWALHDRDVCRLANLTALFILLPLLLLLSLVLCWCCGRKKKRKETPSFSPARKRSSNPQCNGRWPNAKPPALSETKAKEVIMKNQLMIQPSSTLSDSTRDIYEEVEIKLGSVDSLAPQPSSASTEASKQDLDAMSVTEVMKDSADREKAYLIQSTEYYSLVPGIEMEDSDHGEYESVDVS